MKVNATHRALLRAQSARPNCFRSATLDRYQSTSSSSPQSSAPPSWTRALPEGVNPAYDIALAYLSEQQSLTLSSLARLRALPNPTPAIMRRIDQLEIEAHVNDPAVRQTFRESKGRGMLDQPVMRHLAERRWRKEGGLDLVMGRVYQNKVVPDLVPDLGPTSPLNLTLATGLVEPGAIIDPSDFLSPPKVTFQTFSHPSEPTASDPTPTGLYTILVIDPDSPSPQTQSFTQRLHFLKTDIPLSILTGETDVMSDDIGRILTPWEPPAPECGSGRHRYVFILLHQNSSSSPGQTSPRREDFDYRAFVTEHGFTNNSLIGINLFRAIWSEEQADVINSVYRIHRRMADGAPVYGSEQGERYEYPLSAREKRNAGIRQQALEEYNARKMEV
ncbi:MAG: hypothetical protein TREMPRED_001373 [Tremellales sp. Tagirdzhanova-0007]|nr:MAG: hypothetical protein TREMPRED_001373 [Tremellales sp. Tagirdzhanova-0007]